MHAFARTPTSKPPDPHIEAATTTRSRRPALPPPYPPEHQLMPDASPPPSVMVELARTTSISRGSSCWLLDALPARCAPPPRLHLLTPHRSYHWPHRCSTPPTARRQPAQLPTIGPLPQPYPHLPHAHLASRPPASPHRRRCVVHRACWRLSSRHDARCRDPTRCTCGTGQAPLGEQRCVPAWRRPCAHLRACLRVDHSGTRQPPAGRSAPALARKRGAAEQAKKTRVGFSRSFMGTCNRPGACNTIVAEWVGSYSRGLARSSGRQGRGPKKSLEIS